MNGIAIFLYWTFFWMLCSVSSADPGEKWDPQPAVIFTNGRVVTVDREFSIHEGLAVKGERIIAVGTDVDVLGHRGDKTRVYDLEGKTIIPEYRTHIYIFWDSVTM